MADALRNYEETRPIFNAKLLFNVKRLPYNGFTYRDYLTWGDDYRWELIDGMPYMMAGASVYHQSMVVELLGQLREFLKGKPCKVFTAPFDVRLFPEDDLSDRTVVQPDILVVCDEEKLSYGKACRGAPDFIIEVMSDSSEGRDLIDKRKLYETAGVKEYWVVGEEKLYKYVLIDYKYQEAVFDRNKDFKQEVFVLKGCTINL